PRATHARVLPLAIAFACRRRTRGGTRGARATCAASRGSSIVVMGRSHSPPPSPVEARPAAIEALLTEKGLVSPEFIDSIISAYANDIGPTNGAKVVARAWVDGEYRERLLDDGTAAIAELGFGGPEGEHMVVVENTPDIHNVI